MKKYCRTINYISGANQKEKNDYKNQTYDLIVDLLDGYPRINDRDYSSFDDWHKEAIKRIIDKSKEYPKLFEENHIIVGQAQKWLNMSIKYMRMMGILNNDIDLESIHIPIDNYIVDAANKAGRISKLFEVEGLGIKPALDKKWSLIKDYEVYSDYQEKIREALKVRDYAPIDWEEEAWMAEATIRDNKKKRFP